MSTKPAAVSHNEPLVDCQPIKELLTYSSDRAFWEFVKTQNVPRYVLNKRVIRFRVSEVEEWLAERRKGGAL